MLSRFSDEVLLLCGANTYCSNTDGAFACFCNTGYEMWAAGVGCSDLDECSTPGWSDNKWSVILHINIKTWLLLREWCGSNAYCVDQVGWTVMGEFQCGCDPGFESWQAITGKI